MQILNLDVQRKVVQGCAVQGCAVEPAGKRTCESGGGWTTGWRVLVRLTAHDFENLPPRM
jgi:hypothetical protein